MLYPTGKTLPVLLTCIFLFVFTIINAQGTGRLSGKVVDRATQKLLLEFLSCCRIVLRAQLQIRWEVFY
jgi:hypothetical protein